MAATILEKASITRHAATSGSCLRVERRDIRFTTRADGLVEIRIVVTNTGDECSQPTVSVVSAAPLGAFVPWRPIATVPVPELAPGESFTVRTHARRPRPRSLGTFDRVPPRQVLIALAADDDDPPPRRSGFRLRDLVPFRRRPGRSAAASAAAQPAGGTLPVDLCDLFARGNPHWAGNINIFVGGRNVERHMAEALRVYPGRANLAMFIVGSRRDAYAFQLRGAAAEWDAALVNMTQARSFSDGGSLVPQDAWVELEGQGTMILALHPSKHCSRESVEVHVTQRSTGQAAVVEFSLDPNAAGPGCYVV
jgi:hypothetical protein